MSRRTKKPGRPTLEQRVEAFRALVWKGVLTAIEKGHTMRSYEGALSLQWPPYSQVITGCARYSLHLSFSVLGGTNDQLNHYVWRGRGWAEVFRKATADVEYWISEIAEQGREGGAR